MLEYALVLALVALMATLALRMNHLTITQAYCNIASQLGSKTACTQSYCQDDFSGGMENWSNENGKPASGNWKPGDGQLCATGANNILNSCSMNDMSASDYTIHLKDVVLNKGSGYGVYFRTTIVNGKVNGYSFQYDPGYGGFIMRKWVNGKELPPFAVAPAKNFDYFGEAHDIDIQISGDTFTAFIDGQAILTGHDTSYSEGGAGLRVWDSTNVCFGGFEIGPNQSGN